MSSLLFQVGKWESEEGHPQAGRCSGDEEAISRVEGRPRPHTGPWHGSLPPGDNQALLPKRGSCRPRSAPCCEVQSTRASECPAGHCISSGFLLSASFATGNGVGEEFRRAFGHQQKHQGKGAAVRVGGLSASPRPSSVPWGRSYRERWGSRLALAASDDTGPFQQQGRTLGQHQHPAPQHGLCHRQWAHQTHPRHQGLLLVLYIL